jgi:hypothetical protein
MPWDVAGNTALFLFAGLFVLVLAYQVYRGVVAFRHPRAGNRAAGQDAVARVASGSPLRVCADGLDRGAGSPSVQVAQPA